VIPVAATIFAAVAVGIGAERRWGEGAQRAASLVLRTMLYAFAPFIAFFNIARLEIDVNVGGGLALAYAMLALVGAIAYVVGSRVLRLSRPSTGAVMVASMQANTGFVGLPIVLALLGSEHLGEAAAYDAMVTVGWLFGPVFAVGAAFGDRAGEGVRERTRAFFLRNPPLFAVIAALLAPDSLAPDVLVDASRGLILAMVPLGFFAVGAYMAAEAEEGVRVVPPPLNAPVVSAIVLRLVVAPALLLAMAAPLIDLPGTYVLMAAMPCGLNTLVVAHAYGLDLGIAAAAVAWTTAIVVVAALGAGLL
jgi:predicted permease